MKKILKNIAFYRRLLIVFVVIMIIIRPTFSSEKVSREISNLNLWLVVDATGSMVAKDIENGNKRRFEKVQEDITNIVSSFPGAKYGLIVQDFSSYLASPLSTSADAIISAESYVRPKYSMYSRPSNLSELLEFASEKISTYKTRHPERSNVIVFMSDGEDVSGASISVPSELDKNLDGSAVFGYGTTNGTKIEQIGGFIDNEMDYTAIRADQFVGYYGSDPNIEYDSQHNVISKINENNLKIVAEKLSGNYYHREDGDIPNAVISDIKNVAMKNYHPSETNDSVNKGAEIYWIFALVLLVLLLLEGKEILAKILSEKEASHA